MGRSCSSSAFTRRRGGSGLNRRHRGILDMSEFRRVEPPGPQRTGARTSPQLELVLSGAQRSLRQRFGRLNLAFEVGLERQRESRHQQERADQQRKDHDEDDGPAGAAVPAGVAR